MKSVNLNRDELLKIVRANLITHIATYNESVEDYKALVLKIAAENLKLAKTGDLEKIAAAKPLPQAPRSYEDSYNRAIRMLELSVDDVIELQEDVFNQLVLDEWHWKQSFTTSSTFYKSAL